MIWELRDAVLVVWACVTSMRYKTGSDVPICLKLSLTGDGYNSVSPTLLIASPLV